MIKLLSFSVLFLASAAFGQTLQKQNKPILSFKNYYELSSFAPQRIQLKTGVQLEYVEQGDSKGTPVLFLHGITDSWHSFETTFPYLPGSIHAIALSQRGHGDSQRPKEGYTPKDFAADAAAFVEEKKLGSVIVVGHSMGGIVAQRFAINYPHLTRGLVIICSDPVASKNPGMPEFYAEVQQMQTAPDKEFMTGFQKACLAKPIDSAYFNTLVDESLKVPLHVFKAALKGMTNADYREPLKKVTAPGLILWGDKDAFFQRQGQEALKKSLKNAKWVVYEGVGHALHWEEPQRFAKDIASFVAQQGAAK